MKRTDRIALEILGPAPIGAVGLILGFLCVGPVTKSQFIHPGMDFFDYLRMAVGLPILVLCAFLFFTFFGYLFSIIPSLLSSLLLELMFSLGLKPTSLWTVGVSGLLGAASGWGIGSLLPIFPQSFTQGMFILLGLFTGLIIGLIIRRSERMKIHSRPIETGS